MYHHKGKAEQYERRLLLEEATAVVSYQMNGYTYKREHLVSQKYQVVAIRLTTDCPQGLTFSVNMSRKPFEEHTESLSADTVCNYGECGPGGVHYFHRREAGVAGGKSRSMGILPGFEMFMRHGFMWHAEQIFADPVLWAIVRNVWRKRRMSDLRQSFGT